MSYIDENTGKMVLRCRNYPKKGSKEWIISGDSIEFRVIEKEEKTRTFLISDLTKAHLRASPVRSSLDFTFKVNGRTVIVPLISFEAADAINVAQKMYDYISERNPNIPPHAPVEAEPSQPCVDKTDEKYTYTKKAPGRILLRTIGIIYVLSGGLLAFGLLNEVVAIGTTGTMMAVLYVVLRLFTGISGIIRCNDLTRTDALQRLAIFNLFLTVHWRQSIFAAIIVFTLSILFLIGASKNKAAYKQLQRRGVRAEKPEDNPKESKRAKPLGRTFLKIIGLLYIFFGILATGFVLITSVLATMEQGLGSLLWVGGLLLLLPSCFGLFTGIFGVVKSNDLEKTRTLRVLAIINLVLFGLIGLGGLGERLPILIAIIGFALPILFLVGVQIRSMD